MISPYYYYMYMLPDMILNHNKLHSMGQPLKTERLVTSESCHDANFAVTSAVGGCLNDKLRCHPWRQSRHRGNFRFSVTGLSLQAKHNSVQENENCF